MADTKFRVRSRLQTKIQLTKNAQVVLEKRYLLRNELGKIMETAEMLFQRVAKAVAEPEARERMKWAEKFYEMMAAMRFLPNSPTLMNAGKSFGQLSACFVLPVRDSLDSIFETLRYAAKIHQSGGGTGFSFSKVRSRGSLVRSTLGVASGPVSFIRIFDITTDTIKQGGSRRGANMAVLRVDHPDILEFVNAKVDLTSLTNFNISVGITNEFMQAVRKRQSFWLVDPRVGNTRCISANVLFDRIVRSAWECGDPGLVFLDRINLFNPTPQEGPMESTNPCGEQPLLPYESCNLGSLNVSAYYSNKGFNWRLFREDIEVSVRFLDNVIDINYYPIQECKKITLRNRKIGLGVMGFADLLLKMGIPYSAPEAISWGEKVMSFLDREAKRTSAHLAMSRGPFVNWEGSMWQSLGYRPMRNATVSTVAPTGTISMLAGTSSSIEPLFSGIFYRNVLSGERLVEVHPFVEEALAGRNLNLKTLDDEKIAAELGSVWSPAAKVSPEIHVRMQAVFQRHSDSAISKTINLPESATLADVEKAYHLAYDLGCKGITVYRDKSRPAQVLEYPSTEAVVEGDECPIC